MTYLVSCDSSSFLSANTNGKSEIFWSILSLGHKNMFLNNTTNIKELRMDCVPFNKYS